MYLGIDKCLQALFILIIEATLLISWMTWIITTEEDVAASLIHLALLIGVAVLAAWKWPYFLARVTAKEIKMQGSRYPLSEVTGVDVVNSNTLGYIDFFEPRVRLRDGREVRVSSLRGRKSSATIRKFVEQVEEKMEI